MRSLIMVLLAVVIVSGCSSSRSEKTELIRNLSQPELAEAYASLDELERKGAPMNLKGQKIPPAIARLEPESVMIRGSNAWIHVAGAFDDKVYVFVNGLGESQGDKEIVLSPGEHEPPQVLWRQSR